MIYDSPKYYEIAFSFIDSKKQIDFFEKLSHKYGIKINRFFDVACGPSVQAEEILKRRYKLTLLDLSEPPHPRGVSLRSPAHFVSQWGILHEIN